MVLVLGSTMRAIGLQKGQPVQLYTQNWYKMMRMKVKQGISKVKAFGEGHNYSFVPGFMANKFFKELDKVSKKDNLQITNFKKHKILEDTSIADKIAASIPITLEGYKMFLNKKQHLHHFEGIWSSDDGDYVLGVLYDSNNPQFKYKGFIISTERGNWKQGAIKAEWHSLEDDDLCIGDWYAGNKLKTTMVFKNCISRY